MLQVLSLFLQGALLICLFVFVVVVVVVVRDGDVVSVVLIPAGSVL